MLKITMTKLSPNSGLSKVYHVVKHATEKITILK